MLSRAALTSKTHSIVLPYFQVSAAVAAVPPSAPPSVLPSIVYGIAPLCCQLRSLRFSICPGAPTLCCSLLGSIDGCAFICFLIQRRNVHAMCMWRRCGDACEPVLCVVRAVSSTAEQCQIRDCVAQFGILQALPKCCADALVPW